MAEDKLARIEGPYRVSYGSVDELILAYSNDLARGGMFLDTDALLPPNTPVRIHLELPEGGGVISVIARVVTVSDGKRGKPPGMGVEFEDVGAGWLERIEDFIARSAGAGGTGPIPIAPQLNLLLVEDDEGYRDLIAQLFRSRGDRVRTARDGLEALAQCLKEVPDVILADVQMPRMDGWQLLRVVRARPALAAVPFVFLTTLDGESTRLAGYQLGVDDYIPKPCRTDELVARVDRVVQRALQAWPQPTERKPTLHGDLEQVSLPAVLTLLELERKSGTLVIDGERTALLLMRDGRPIRLEVYGADPGAKTAELLGEMIDWRSGSFEFTAEPVEGEDKVRAGVTELLMEAARRRDERRR